MIDPAAIKYLRISLIGLSLAFAGIMAFEYQSGYKLDDDKSNDNAIDDSTAALMQSANETLSIEDYDEIIERPLFYNTRRPIPEQDEVVEATSGKPGRTVARQNNELLLSAVIIKGEQRIALIQTDRGRSTEKVTIGGSIDNWTLTAIEPHKVSLSRDGEVKTLELLVKQSPIKPLVKNRQNRNNTPTANNTQTRPTGQSVNGLPLQAPPAVVQRSSITNNKSQKNNAPSEPDKGVTEK